MPTIRADFENGAAVIFPAFPEAVDTEEKWERAKRILERRYDGKIIKMEVWDFGNDS